MAVFDETTRLSFRNVDLSSRASNLTNAPPISSTSQQTFDGEHHLQRNTNNDDVVPQSRIPDASGDSQRDATSENSTNEPEPLPRFKPKGVHKVHPSFFDDMPTQYKDDAHRRRHAANGVRFQEPLRDPFVIDGPHGPAGNTSKRLQSLPPPGFSRNPRNRVLSAARDNGDGIGTHAEGQRNCCVRCIPVYSFCTHACSLKSMMTVQPYDGTRLYDGYASEGTRMIQSAPQQPKNTTKGSLAGLKPNCRQKRCTGFLPTYRYIQDMCFQCREKGCTKESLLAGRTLVAQEMQFEAEARAAKKASYPGGCYPMVLQVRELLRGINQKGNSNEANRDRDPKIASGPRLGSNPKVKYRLLDSGSSQLHQNTRRNSDRTKPIALDKASLVDKAPGRVNRFVLDEWIEQITIESQERDESQEPKLKRVLDLRSREVLEPSTQKTLSRKQGKRFANVIAQTPTTTLTSFRNYEEYSDASRPSLRQQFVQRDPDRPIKPVQIIGDQGGGEEWADVSLTKSKSS